MKIKLLMTALPFVSLPSMAALPQITAPSGGGIGGAAVQDGDFIGMVGAYMKAGLTMMAFVIVAYLFVRVIIGGLAKWKEYTSGQAQFGDLKEYIVASVILVAFAVMLAGYAISTLA